MWKVLEELNNFLKPERWKVTDRRLELSIFQLKVMTLPLCHNFTVYEFFCDSGFGSIFLYFAQPLFLHPSHLPSFSLIVFLLSAAPVYALSRLRRDKCPTLNISFQFTKWEAKQ